MQSEQTRRTVIIVTGDSGAGKSAVLNTLEDCGFVCVDNLPIVLLDSFLAVMAGRTSVAIGIDIRSGDSCAAIIATIERMRATSHDDVQVLFLTSSTSVLLKRFQETRRKHPLVDNQDIADAIKVEKELLAPLKRGADKKLNTDQLTIHQLRALIRAQFVAMQDYAILVSLTSFGFKHGVPPESNFVYDLRSLPNPYFVPELKKFSGKDQNIIDYLFAHAQVQEYWQRLHDFVEYSIACAHSEGRVSMNIALGCTGGRHRSVAFVQQLAQESFAHARVVAKHRDVEK